MKIIGTKINKCEKLVFWKLEMKINVNFGRLIENRIFIKTKFLTLH